jgi:transposase InsO family protein
MQLHPHDFCQSIRVEYMTERIHSALDYLTPAEFEAAHRPVTLLMSC